MLAGSEPRHGERIDHGGALPDLLRMKVGWYLSETAGPAHRALAELLRQSFAGQRARGLSIAAEKPLIRQHQDDLASGLTAAQQVQTLMQVGEGQLMADMQVQRHLFMQGQQVGQAVLQKVGAEGQIAAPIQSNDRYILDQQQVGRDLRHLTRGEPDDQMASQRAQRPQAGIEQIAADRVTITSAPPNARSAPRRSGVSLSSVTSAPACRATACLSAPRASATTRAPIRLPSSTAVSPTPPDAPVTTKVSPGWRAAR